MKRNKPFWIPLAWIFCLTTTHFSVHADYTLLGNGNYDPQSIAEQFNGPPKTFTGNKEFREGFQYSTPAVPVNSSDQTLRNLLFEPRGESVVDVSAYLQGGYGGIDEITQNSFITTFRCTRSEATKEDGYAWLSYENGKTYYGNDFGKVYLTLGAAFLYAQFVQGNLRTLELLGGNEFEFDAAAFRQALDELHKESSNSDGLWESNMYLSQLLSLTPSGSGIVPKDYWCADYNLLEDYSEIGFGDYYIFVLRVYDDDPEFPNEWAGMLYAALKSEKRDDPPTGVPEPATLLLWTLGGLGLGGIFWLRHRK